MFAKTMKTADLCLFFRICRRYIKAGIPVEQCVKQYAKDYGGKNEVLKTMADGMARDLSNGMSFSDAIQGQPKYFPGFIVGLSKVGEVSGQLKEFFTEIIFFLKQDMRLTREVQSGLRGAKWLTGAAIAALALTLFVVIPNLSKMLASFPQVEIPWPTKIAMALGDGLSSHWMLCLCVVLLAVGSFIWLSIMYPYRIDKIRLKLPFVGIIYRQMAHYKFCKVISLCMKTGNILPEQAFLYASTALDNRVYADIIDRAAKAVNQGMHIDKALEKADVRRDFDHNIYVMLQSGVRTGSLSQIMEEEAEEYQETLLDLSKDIGNRISACVDIPIMLLILGLVAATYFPMFNIASLAGGGLR